MGVSASRDISITTTERSISTAEKDNRARAAMIIKSGVPSIAMKKVKTLRIVMADP